MTEIETTAAEIVETLPDDVAESVTVAELENKLRDFRDHSVPLDRAKEKVRNSYLEVSDSASDGSESTDVKLEIEDITAEYDETYVSVVAEVVSVYQEKHTPDAAVQKCEIADATGKITLTVWGDAVEESTGFPLEENESYSIEGIRVEKYQGRMYAQAGKTTTAKSVSKEIDPVASDVTFRGTCLSLQSRSGLVKRCGESGCNRTISDGRCGEHGQVEGEFDLRVKANIDTGQACESVIFDREQTEDITGITFEEAKEMAKEELDPMVVSDKIREELIGEVFEIKGDRLGNSVIALDFTMANLEGLEPAETYQRLQNLVSVE